VYIFADTRSGLHNSVTTNIGISADHNSLVNSRANVDYRTGADCHAVADCYTVLNPNATTNAKTAAKRHGTPNADALRFQFCHVGKIKTFA
jgi:hypothetical protein